MSEEKILKDIVLSAVSHAIGIVPPNNVFHDVNRALAHLPPHEARAMRRKFRKLWRKFVKNPTKGTSQDYLKQLEMGSETPSKRARLHRKKEVLRQLMSQAVTPTLKSKHDEAVQT